MGIRVRAFVETDRAVLQRVFVAARDAAFVWAEPGAHLLEDFDRTTEGEVILVALWEEEAVGFASIWEPDHFLHSLFVHPAFQGRGVGKALLAACAPYFGAAATLKCLKANEAAKQFYLSQGWVVREEGESPEGAYFLMGRGVV